MLMAKLRHRPSDNHAGGCSLRVPGKGLGTETRGGLGSLLSTCLYLHVSSRDHLVLLEGEAWGGSLPLFSRP